LIESLYLVNQPVPEILNAHHSLESGPPVDLRYSAEIAPARSIVDHVAGECDGRCLERLSELADAHALGARLVGSPGASKSVFWHLSIVASSPNGPLGRQSMKHWLPDTSNRFDGGCGGTPTTPV